MRWTAVLAAAATLLAVTAWPAVAAPSEGNSGKKSVVNEVLGPFPVSCDDDVELQVTLYLTEQYMDRAHGKNTQVATFSNRYVYSNAAGETWTHQDRGSNQYYEENGVAVTGVSGRSGFGAIGRIVYAEEPFEILLEAGRWIDIDAEACARLS